MFGPGGAMEALVAAKQAGKIRFIGFTGHKSPAIHLEMLEAAAAHRFTFDTVQMPLNVMDAHYDSFERRVVPSLAKANIGVLGDEAARLGPVVASAPLATGGCRRATACATRWASSTSVVITGCESMRVLVQALTPPTGSRALVRGAQGAARPHGAAPRTRGSGRSTRSPTCSTAPAGIRTGWKAPRCSGGLRPEAEGAGQDLERRGQVAGRLAVELDGDVGVGLDRLGDEAA